MEPDYSFARRPLWLVGHVVAAAAVVLFISLGLWQLDRHEGRTALDARLESRLADSPLDFADALQIDTAELEFRRVAAVGEFVASEEVVLFLLGECPQASRLANRRSYTPLHMACFRSDFSLAVYKLLLKHLDTSP